jgi:hypothetical protein
MRLRRPQLGQLNSKPDSFNSIVFMLFAPQNSWYFCPRPTNEIPPIFEKYRATLKKFNWENQGNFQECAERRSTTFLLPGIAGPSASKI